MTIEEPPEATPKLRLIGTVWAVVGFVAIIVGLFVTVTAIVVFGGIALVAGLAVYAVQVARERSAERTARRMAGGPVSPVSAPAPSPAPMPAGPAAGPAGPGGAQQYRRRSWLRRDVTGGSQDPRARGADMADEAPASEGPLGSDAADDTAGTDTATEASASASEVDDGTGDVAEGGMDPDDGVPK